MPPLIRNQDQIENLKKKFETIGFEDIFFENNCKNKLSDSEYNELNIAFYSLLLDKEKHFEGITEPLSITCLLPRAADNPLKDEFIKLRNTIALLKHHQYNNNHNKIKNNSRIPFPISCDFDGSKQKKCGMYKEGIYPKISFDVNCIKKDPKNIVSATQGLFIHEFAHSIRHPQSLTEEQVKKIDQGICDYFDDVKVFGTPEEHALSQQKLEKALNSPNPEYKTIPKEVINPYAAFDPASEVASPTAATASASSTGTVARRSTASAAALQPSRAVANSGNTQINYNIPELNSFNLPESHYQATKQYVNNTMAAISKRIAPVVRAIESPAFAEDLKNATASSGAGLAAIAGSSNGGASESSSAGLDFASGNGSAPTGGASTSSEIASAGGSSGSGASRIKATNTGRSNYKPGSPKATASEAGKSSSQEPDLGIDKAYALKIRRQLISDEEFREQLHQNGVYIQFSDGYLFKSPEKKIQYNEINGVLTREN